MKCYVCEKEITGDSCKVTCSLKFLGNKGFHHLRKFNFRKMLLIKDEYAHLTGETMCSNCYMSVMTAAKREAERLREKHNGVSV